MITFTPMASANFNPKFILIYTLSGRWAHCYDEQGIISILSPDSTDEKIGYAIIQSLASSRNIYSSTEQNIPKDAIIDENFYEFRKRMPIYEAFMQSLMDKFSYKTKSAMFKKWKRTSIRAYMENKKVEVMPWKRKRLDSWGTYHSSQNIVLDYPVSNEELGKAFRQSLLNAI